ncbi:MAG: hypothetical protein J0G30_03850 [Actinomycetales bacterium]|nr:hypothetical protein [Actinomycetales bacterium]
MTSRASTPWIALAVAAPAAAAVFAGSAAWAIGHDPLAEQRAAQAAQDAAVAQAFPRPATVAATERVAELQAQLAQLRTQIDQLAAQAAAVRASTPSTSGWSGGGSGGSGGSSGGGASAVAPPPPPPASATTSGSR